MTDPVEDPFFSKFLVVSQVHSALDKGKSDDVC